MEALAENGNVAEALRVYERLRVLLREELGPRPAAEVQELHRRLLAGGAAGRHRPPSRLDASARRAFRCPACCRRASAQRSSDASGARRPAGGVGAGALRQPPARAGGRRAGDRQDAADERARARGARPTAPCSTPRCQEEALVSYQPFVEALRHYVRSTGLDWARIALGPGGRELARLIPELAAALPVEQAVRPGDPETRRYLLFEAVSPLLSETSAQGPARARPGRPPVGGPSHPAPAAARDQSAARGVAADRRHLPGAELGREHPLAELLADLRRDRLFERVSLDGPGRGRRRRADRLACRLTRRPPGRREPSTSRRTATRSSSRR